MNTANNLAAQSHSGKCLQTATLLRFSTNICQKAAWTNRKREIFPCFLWTYFWFCCKKVLFPNTCIIIDHTNNLFVLLMRYSIETTENMFFFCIKWLILWCSWWQCCLTPGSSWAGIPVWVLYVWSWHVLPMYVCIGFHQVLWHSSTVRNNHCWVNWSL